MGTKNGFLALRAEPPNEERDGGLLKKLTRPEEKKNGPEKGCCDRGTPGSKSDCH